ncbi:hypothetical protein KKE60_08080 [Patescibacteria group bacterium]|nr:hypothetical protein [Patescibacteria group bacterium]
MTKEKETIEEKTKQANTEREYTVIKPFSRGAEDFKKGDAIKVNNDLARQYMNSGYIRSDKKMQKEDTK